MMIALMVCLLSAPVGASAISSASMIPFMTMSSSLRGTWDAGPFENDDAMDWYFDFIEAPSWDKIHLAFVPTTLPRYLEADEASIAVAAAALVAAVRQGRFETLPVDGREAVASLGTPSSDLLYEASHALSRVQSSSELAELWAEGDATLWTASLSLIRGGLT